MPRQGDIRKCFDNSSNIHNSSTGGTPINRTLGGGSAARSCSAASSASAKRAEPPAFPSSGPPVVGRDVEGALDLVQSEQLHFLRASPAHAPDSCTLRRDVG